MERKRFPAGAVIFRQGEYSQDVYRIVSGKAHVSITRDNGEELVLAELIEDDIFGEMAMIDESARSATVTIAQESDLEVMAPADFSEMFFRNPAVLAPYLSCLIDRLRTSNERIHDLTRKLAEANGKNGTPARPALKTGSKLFGDNLMIIPKDDQAKRTMTKPRVPISKFPFRIGRSGMGTSPDLLQKNDLSLINIDPTQVAKNHISIEKENDAIWIRDRKTRRGTIVNGKKLHHENGVLVCRLNKTVNEIILGDEKSPARFELRQM